MYQIMITSMIAFNAFKIDSVSVETEFREKEYIPAPWHVPRESGTETFDHLPYSPVITCIENARDSEVPVTIMLCTKVRPGWFKI